MRAPALVRNADQEWLASVLWPHARNHSLVHAAFHCRHFGGEGAESRGFPTRRSSAFDFVGNVFDASNQFLGLSHLVECPAECRREPDWMHC